MALKIKILITTKLVKHADANDFLLKNIANLKSIRWDYPLAKQLEWMDNNLSANDIHLLVYFDDVLIAYTNFVRIEVIINDINTPFVGIGNVCTLESGKGYGDHLMSCINDAILNNNWKGILLCKDHLVPYYSKYQWLLVDKNKIESSILKDSNTMLFNFADEINMLEYNNSLF